MRVFARHCSQDAERRSDRVASPLDGEFDDFPGIEVGRVFGERCAGAVLDALVYRKNRQVPRAAEPPRVEKLLHGAEHARLAVRTKPYAVHEVRPRQIQMLFRNGGTLVVEQMGGFFAENFGGAGGKYVAHEGVERMKVWKNPDEKTAL